MESEPHPEISTAFPILLLNLFFIRHLEITKSLLIEF